MTSRSEELRAKLRADRCIDWQAPMANQARGSQTRATRELLDRPISEGNESVNIRAKYIAVDIYIKA